MGRETGEADGLRLQEPGVHNRRRLRILSKSKGGRNGDAVAVGHDFLSSDHTSLLRGAAVPGHDHNKGRTVPQRIALRAHEHTAEENKADSVPEPDFHILVPRPVLFPAVLLPLVHHLSGQEDRQGREYASQKGECPAEVRGQGLQHTP